MSRTRFTLRTLAVATAVLTLAASQARSQETPGGFSQDDAEIFQQMSQMGQEVLQRMQDQGIDLADFTMGVLQEMADGTFDPGVLQQRLIDQGLIDPQTVTRMQTGMQRLALNQIRQQLAPSSEEWAVLLPKLQRLVAAQRELGMSTTTTRGLGAQSIGMMTGEATGPAIRAMRELRSIVQQPTATEGDIRARVITLRQAMSLARQEYVAAQLDLQRVLTLRQEAVLVNMGMLD